MPTRLRPFAIWPAHAKTGHRNSESDVRCPDLTLWRIFGPQKLLFPPKILTQKGYLYGFENVGHSIAWTAGHAAR